MKRTHWFAAAAWLLVSAVSAETLYVTDKVTVGLRADVTPGAAVLAAASTGAKLEVLERSGAFVRVRDGNGVEGWVDATALAPQAPATEQVKVLRAELDRTRAQLANTQGLLEKSRAAPPPPEADKLQAELAGTRAQLGKIQSELKKKDEEIASAAAARDAAVSETATLRETLAREQAARQAAAAKPPVASPSPPDEVGFSFIWLGIAFAMLLLGFVGGIVWVKESIRRRMGGLHLRI